MEVEPIRGKKRSAELRLDSALPINDQPVENRRQLVGTEPAAAQKPVHSPQDAFRQSQIAASGKSKKTQRTQIIDCKPFFYSEQQLTL